MKDLKHSEGYIPAHKWVLLGAVAFAIFLIYVSTPSIFEALDSRTQGSVCAGIIIVLYLVDYGSKSLCINENGVTVFHFGIKTRHVPWSNVDQVGMGRTAAGAAIVITLKGGKRYEIYRKSGSARDADIFELFHHKSCLVIEKYKSDRARPLVEKYYGKLDFEWIPPED